jgi:tetratricopeptide (TPR) repeat protein
MLCDALGNLISTTRADTAAGIDDFVLGFLGYDLRIVKVLQAADNDPDDTMVNVYASLLWLLSETGDIPPQARHYLARAEQAQHCALQRERAALQIARAWLDDDIAAARRLAAETLRAHQRDLVMLKLHQYIDFQVGDFPSMLRAALACLPAAADVAYLHGMLAFAYEECHLLGHAEAAARHALSLQSREPWAQHALAHVMLTHGRIDEGTAFLESARAGWAGLTSFMDTHLWWHLALFYLSRGRFAQALAAYDDHCWARERDFSQDQVGAVSLLARFECAGIDVGARWHDLGEHLAARRQDVTQPFLTLQYFYGLARTARPEAATLLAAIRAAPENAPAFSRTVWRDVALPLAEGLAAYAAADHEAALRWIKPNLHRLSDIGGSHAQRDLFEQIVLDAMVRSGQLRRAQQVLELRRSADPLDVPVNRALALVYEALGLAELAAEAREKGSVRF